MGRGRGWGLGVKGGGHTEESPFLDFGEGGGDVEEMGTLSGDPVEEIDIGRVSWVGDERRIGGERADGWGRTEGQVCAVDDYVAALHSDSIQCRSQNSGQEGMHDLIGEKRRGR